ncbi:MFS transporter [Epibacterium sp. SM1979]|uniref:MFS transporter n=2 Tax=Tritonibacter litoralis TaxID=2662264 RepID=A0A843YDI7_9RHOB|nr:MFS transporter [Tritonibacter litoralis]
MGLFWGIFGAYVPAIKAQVDLGDAAFGGALFLAAFGAALSMILGPWVDRQLGRWAMSVSAGLMAVCFVVPGLVTGWWPFAIAMLFAMGFTGVLDVIMNTRVSQIEAETGRSLMNLNHAIYSFAYGLAAILAGVARGQGLGAAQCFLIAALMTLALCLGMRHHPAHQAPEETVTKPRLPHMLLLMAGLVTLFAFMSEQAVDNWSALHLERMFDVRAHESALGPAILGLTMGIGRLSGQVVLQGWPEGRVLRMAGALSALGVLIGVWAPVLWLAYLGFALFGLGVSVTGPMALAWVGKVVPPHLRAQAISRVVMVAYAGFFFGPPMLGVLSEVFGLRIAFTVIAASLASITLVLVPMLRHLARSGGQGDASDAPAPDPV